MKQLVFHTEIPFGYFLFAASLLILAIAAVALIIIGLRAAQQKSWLFISACTLLACVVLTVAANVNEEVVDLNPLIREHAELFGTWKDATSSLELLPDGHYTCNGNVCTRVGINGSWQRSGDFFISFDPVNSPQVVWRVTSLAGRLQLATGDSSTHSDLRQSEGTLKHTAAGPNPSIEKTLSGKPASASHVKR